MIQRFHHTEPTIGARAVGEDSTDWSRRSFKISPVLARRIDRHVFLHKCAGSPQSNKQKWIEQAVRSKLNREQSQSVAETEKNLNFKLDSELAEAVIRRVNALKNLYVSYSVKRWIIDAIEEQLEEERDTVRTWAKKLVY